MGNMNRVDEQHKQTYEILEEKRQYFLAMARAMETLYDYNMYIPWDNM